MMSFKLYPLAIVFTTTLLQQRTKFERLFIQLLHKSRVSTTGLGPVLPRYVDGKEENRDTRKKPSKHRRDQLWEHEIMHQAWFQL